MTANPRQDSKLLINEPALQVLPTLAKAIGLNEAIVLQQIHYWMNTPKIGRWHDGRKWVKNSIEEWHEENFSFWSLPTLKRIFASLDKLGVILKTKKLNPNRYDKVLWYSIDYEALDKYHFDTYVKYQNDTFEEDQVDPSESIKMIPSYKEKTTSEITSETTITAPDIHPTETTKPSSKKKRSTRKPWADLTDALHNATPVDIRSRRPHYAAANEAAKALYEDGITPEQVKAYAEANYPGYRAWAEKNGKSPIMSMQHIERKIRGWKPEPVYDPDPYTYVTIIEDGIPVRYISGRKEVCREQAAN